MARIEQLERDKLSARQQALYYDIMRTRPRGKLSGPFSVWIHRPNIAEPEPWVGHLENGVSVGWHLLYAVLSFDNAQDNPEPVEWVVLSQLYFRVINKASKHRPIFK